MLGLEWGQFLSVAYGNDYERDWIKLWRRQRLLHHSSSRLLSLARAHEQHHLVVIDGFQLTNHVILLSRLQIAKKTNFGTMGVPKMDLQINPMCSSPLIHLIHSEMRHQAGERVGKSHASSAVCGYCKRDVSSSLVKQARVKGCV